MRHGVGRYFFISKIIVYLCIFAAVLFIAAGVTTALRGAWAEAAKNAGYIPQTGVSSSLPAAVYNAGVAKSEGKAVSSAVLPQPSQSPNGAGNGWFKDAVFIGNSRTEGLRNYDGLDGAEYYAQKGLMVDTVYTKKLAAICGRECTAMQAVKEKRFGKVYLMFGINELGWSSSQTFFDDYGKIINDIKKDAPKTAIYIQSIMPVSEKKSGSSKIYNNAKIKEFNERLKKLARDEKVKYLDIAAAVSDTNGALPDGASVDGVHLNAQYCGKWCDYLKTHI